MSKIILITGSTDGIGKGTALKLAKEGHTIYIHGRSEEKIDKVIVEIKEASNNKNVKGFVADFSDLNAVKRLAEQIKSDVPRLDILINNAGILTENIVSVLEKSTETRVINLSSAAQTSVKKGILTGDVAINASDAYAQSKLALTMWSFHFAKQHPSITTIAVNPGSLLNTKMAKEAYGQHWSPAEKGVNILYDLATSDAYKDATGKYFDNDKGETMGHFSQTHPDAYDIDLIENLLETTKSMVSEL